MEKDKNKFDAILDTRKLEIELFWKRSFFFWGFISVTFVAFASFYDKSQNLSIIIACFGVVCSFAWSLVNRGSKYWQEAWENKIERVEVNVTGILFKEEEPVQSYKGFWLSARKYSVSKLTIALSDYVFLIWFIILIFQISRDYIEPNCLAKMKDYGKIFFTFFTILYLVFIAWKAKSSERRVPSQNIVNNKNES